MRNENKINGWLIFFAILSSIAFYVLLFVLAKWFPLWTGRTLQNDWALILISAIPLFLVLVLLFSERMTKAKIGGYEFEFGKTLPQNLIDIEKIYPELLISNLNKQGELDLTGLINEVKNQHPQPKILQVSLDQRGENIRFPILREYIYKLSKFSQIEYIIFLDENNKYIGFTTVDKFKTRFPQFGLEILVDDLRDASLSKQIIEAKLPIVPDANEKRKYLSRINFLVRSQWAHNRDNQGVRVSDLPKLGAFEIWALDSWSIAKVYSILVKGELKGIPIIDKDMNYIGVASQEKIASALILKLLEKADSLEKNL